MTNNHSEHVRELWHRFFIMEESFLDWINYNTVVIDSMEKDRKLSYKVLLNGRTKPPQGFRHVCNLINSDDENELLERIKALKLAYITPVLEEAKENSENKETIDKLKDKFPSRFPEFYTDVKQINLSINPAFSSKKITINDEDEPLLLKTYHAENSKHFDQLKEIALNEVKALVNYGLVTTELYQKRLSGVLKITISSKELLKLANVDTLQLRKKTGDQYRARIFKLNNEVLPVRFGLIILKAPAPVYYVLPQKKRKHALEKSGNELNLPLSSCNYRIWFKEKIAKD